MAAKMAAESSEASIVVATDRALIHFSIIFIVLVIAAHSLASVLRVLTLAATLFQTAGAVVVHIPHETV